MSRWNRYWHDFRVTPGRVVAFRLAFFGVLAFDQWLLMIEHAPRYGAGGFNVPQLSWLAGLPLPTVLLATIGWLLGGFFALRAALGIAIRQSVIGTIICYASLYFWSQADSYQHHYLISLLLLITCMIPENVLAGRVTKTEPSDKPTVGHWAVRLIYVQIALLYGWAAITKCNGLWISGSTMEALTQGCEVNQFLAVWSERLGTDNIHAIAAVAAIFGEFFAMIAFLNRRLWVIGLLFIPWFHISVEWGLQFEIGWFSYFMLALNVTLLMPAVVYERIGDVLSRLRAALPSPQAINERIPSIVWGIIAGGACAAIGYQSPYEGALELAIALGVVGFLGQFPRSGVMTMVGQIACGLVLLATFQTEAPYDYYRLWAGDLNRRGLHESSEAGYRRANELKSTGPARFFKLAKVIARQGRNDEALALVQTSKARLDAQITVDKQALRADTGDDTLYSELAKHHEGLSERCRWLARTYRQTQQNTKATEAQNCANFQNSEAKAAYQKATALNVCNTDARRGLSRMNRQR